MPEKICSIYNVFFFNWNLQSRGVPVTPRHIHISLKNIFKILKLLLQLVMLNHLSVGPRRQIGREVRRGICVCEV